MPWGVVVAQTPLPRWDGAAHAARLKRIIAQIKRVARIRGLEKDVAFIESLELKNGDTIFEKLVGCFSGNASGRITGVRLWHYRPGKFKNEDSWTMNAAGTALKNPCFNFQNVTLPRYLVQHGILTAEQVTSWWNWTVNLKTYLRMDNSGFPIDQRYKDGPIKGPLPVDGNGDT